MHYGRLLPTCAHSPTDEKWQKQVLKVEVLACCSECIKNHSQTPHKEFYTHTQHMRYEGDREADVGITTVRQVTTTEVWRDGPKESRFHRPGDGSSPQQTDRQLEVLIFIKSWQKELQTSRPAPCSVLSRADSALFPFAGWWIIPRAPANHPHPAPFFSHRSFKRLLVWVRTWVDTEFPSVFLPRDEFLIPRVLFVGGNSFSLKALEMIIPRICLTRLLKRILTIYWVHSRCQIISILCLL